MVRTALRKRGFAADACPLAFLALWPLPPPLDFESVESVGVFVGVGEADQKPREDLDCDPAKWKKATTNTRYRTGEMKVLRR